MHFLFFFPFKQTEPQQRVAEYSLEVYKNTPEFE